MTSVNRFGLQRAIPESVKREVRQRCGFGCIICGAALGQYEHFAPEFKDATEHNSRGITYLCATDHDRKTRGRLSTEAVAHANDHPFCKNSGFSWDRFDIGPNQPYILFGGNRIFDCPTPIQVRDLPIFKIRPPERPGTPYLLDANFFNSSGARTLAICSNEVTIRKDNWDVECEGASTIIRDSAGHISLHLKALPPRGISIEKLDMRVYEYHFKGTPAFMEIGQFGSPLGRFSGCFLGSSQIGMMLE